MKITATRIPDVKIIEPKMHGDERGFFMETWNEKAFKAAGITTQFVQDNHCRSIKNTLRGLHYQTKHAQGKLVRVAQGEVFDVTVDLRKSSPTFGQWVGEYLSEANNKMLWVPPGFAHGFFVTSETAHFLYKCTEYYAPEHEHSIFWGDSDLNIAWPIEKASTPIVSEKDAAAQSFLLAEKYL